jgi:hypothetical protein
MAYLQLTQGERYVIGRMRASAKSLREIARCLGRSVSTISREVERNRCPHDGWVPLAKGALMGDRQAQQEPQEEPLQRSGVGRRGGAARAQVEPGADLGPAAAVPSPADQPRDDLPPRAAQPVSRRRTVEAPAGDEQGGPQEAGQPCHERQA